MRFRSAISFALSAAVCGVIANIWYARRHPNDSPELGWTAANIGVVLFSVLPGIFFYLAGALFRLIRGEEEINAPIPVAIVGAPYWFIIGPLHRFTTDRLLLPEGVWWIEMIVICALASETARVGARWCKRPKGGRE